MSGDKKRADVSKPDPRDGGQLENVDFSDGDNMLVRPFDPVDTTSLRELFAQSIEYLTTDDYNDDQRLAWVSRAEDWDEFDERLKSGDTFVIEIDTERAGFTLFKNGNEIDMLFVHPYFVRSGVGTKLLKSVEQLARARGCEEITVDASDTAREFFEKHGFVATERHLIEIDGQWLSNTTMTKTLADEGSLT